MAPFWSIHWATSLRRERDVSNLSRWESWGYFRNGDGTSDSPRYHTSIFHHFVVSRNVFCIDHDSHVSSSTARRHLRRTWPVYTIFLLYASQGYAMVAKGVMSKFSAIWCLSCLIVASL